MLRNPSQELFDQINKGGLQYITNAIKNKQTETYYLDFKSTQGDDYSGRRCLFDSDRKNYAKALSAFGNSEGGVLIWGVLTGKTSEDYATEKKPIKNLSNFISLLESFTSLLTVPPHSNVTHKAIIEDESTDTGYVISHIPKSNRRPFQVVNEEDFRYYIRAGSSFKPAPDTFLRFLFGQEPQPYVSFVWGVSKVQTSILATGEKSIKFKVNFFLRNNGESIAKNLNGYISIAGQGTALEATAHNWCSYYEAKSLGKIAFQAKPDYFLGIEQEIAPLTIHFTLQKPFTSGIRIGALVHADNQSSERFERVIDKDELEKIYDNYVKDPDNYNPASGIFGKDAEPEINSEEPTS